MINIKKIISTLLIVITLFYSIPVFGAVADYDEVGAYRECYTLYPDFVDRVKSFGVTDSQIIYFLGTVEEELLLLDEVLSEENFDNYMFTAIKEAFSRRRNMAVRDALYSAYPEAVPDAMHGIVPEEYMPIYNTVKRYLFGIKAPTITLSGNCDNLLLHHVHMPENVTIFVAFYDGEGNLLHAHKNPVDNLRCDCKMVSYAKAFAFSGNSLSPLCDNFILEF